MRVLVLHGLDDPAAARTTSINHCFSYIRHQPDNEYLYHCATERVTSALSQMQFDVVILDTSFLSRRCMRPRILFEVMRRDYGWLSALTAVKIALPQDEYDHCHLLDDWLSELSVDIIYTCVPHSDVLYPKCSRSARILPALTGYVEDSEIARFRRLSRPWEKRTVDVAYRARALPPNYGRLACQKSEIGLRFLEMAGNRLVCDIAVDADRAIVGDDWCRFLGNARFTLGSLSGASMMDPYGDCYDAVQAYMELHPDADFDVVEQACFPGQEGRYIFSAISPRIFEAAAAGCCQILAEGHYSDALEPWKHYIPLKPDLSNIDAVLAAMKDEARVRGIVAESQAVLLGREEFRYRWFAAAVLSEAKRLLDTRQRPEAQSDFARLAVAHRAELRKIRLRRSVQAKLYRAKAIARRLLGPSLRASWRRFFVG